MSEQQPRDTAASMSLLTRVMDDALDPGYSRAKEDPPEKNRRLGTAWNILILVLAVGLMWATTVSARALYASAAGKPPAAEELAAQVQRASETVLRLEEGNANLEQRIEELQPPGETSEQDDALRTAAATARVTGPGITLTITDNFGGATPLIRDRDMRTLLNALWSGGAEAIAIDGLRIGPQTSVRTAGTSILVNLEPLSSPYVIEAIGNPDMLETALSKGSAARAVRNLEDSLGMSITTTRSSNLALGSLPATQIWYADPMGAEDLSNQGDDPR